MTIDELINEYGQMANDQLTYIMDRAGIKPEILDKSMRYSLFAGGKRIRPVLAMMCCVATGGDAFEALTPACCVEMVHCYSLIHDDLPCMDDDDFRRGKPSNHIVFGEDLAVLSGDALLTQAFETLSDPEFSLSFGYQKTISVINELAFAAGSSGMVSGQVMDMKPDVDNEGNVTADFINRLQSLKTGALITAACRIGALSANATDHQLKSITEYSKNIGLLFQITDDLLDAFGSKELLGKATNKDADKGKVNWVTVFGADTAKKMACEAAIKAKTSIAHLGNTAKPLLDMVDMIQTRKK